MSYQVGNEEEIDQYYRISWGRSWIYLFLSNSILPVCLLLLLLTLLWIRIKRIAWTRKTRACWWARGDPTRAIPSKCTSPAPATAETHSATSRLNCRCFSSDWNKLPPLPTFASLSRWSIMANSWTSRRRGKTLSISYGTWSKLAKLYSKN